MFVVRLNNVFDDIMDQHADVPDVPVSSELTGPILERLDWLESTIENSDVFKRSESIDEEDGEKFERRRRISETIKNYCLQAIDLPVDGTEGDEKRLQKVDRASSEVVVADCRKLSVCVEDPFESYIKCRTESAVEECTKPILQRLKVLERKVSVYEDIAENERRQSSRQSSLDIADSCDLPAWMCNGDEAIDRIDEVKDDGDKEDLVDTKNIRDKKNSVDNENNGNSPKGEEKQVRDKHDEHRENDGDKKDISVVLCDEAFGQIKEGRRRMIVRITSWSYKSKMDPDTATIHYDLTKRRIDLLVEATEAR